MSNHALPPYNPWRDIAVTMACFVLFMVMLFALPPDSHALTPDDADAHAKPVTLQQALRHGRHSVAYRKWIIQQVWGADARLGLRIAYCESGYQTGASDYANHTHLGEYEMGVAERRKYGHGKGAWVQTRSAFAYFKDSGTRPWKSSQHCWKEKGE